MELLLKNATELLLLLFMMITFLQSALDKVFDWGGNLAWLKGHFANSPLNGTVPILLAVVLLVELAAGIFCTVGFFQFVLSGASSFAVYGAILSCLSLLMLLFGQRMAKDYAGAMTIAVYFIPAIFLVYVLQ